MRIVTGNLLDMFDNGEFDVIVQGCNCFHDWGGGIAAQMKPRYPNAYLADVRTKEGDKSKLGTYSVERNTNTGRIIVNAYTQYYGGADARLKAIKIAFQRMGKSGFFLGKRVGIPAIGCGIGGLRWEHVEPAISKSGLDCTLVVFG